MDLPSFLWLWKAAAWSMGLSLVAYSLLGITGIGMFLGRQAGHLQPSWVRLLHYTLGVTLVSLVLFLLAIGVVGTLGHYGTLGHSVHLSAGLTSVVLVVLSAVSATQITPARPWFRTVHIGANIMLFVTFGWVLLTGWSVVQKYLP